MLRVLFRQIICSRSRRCRRNLLHQTGAARAKRRQRNPTVARLRYLQRGGYVVALRPRPFFKRLLVSSCNSSGEHSHAARAPRPRVGYSRGRRRVSAGARRSLERIPCEPPTLAGESSVAFLRKRHAVRWFRERLRIQPRSGNLADVDLQARDASAESIRFSGTKMKHRFKFRRDRRCASHTNGRGITHIRS